MTDMISDKVPTFPAKVAVEVALAVGAVIAIAVGLEPQSSHDDAF